MLRSHHRAELSAILAVDLYLPLIGKQRAGRRPDIGGNLCLIEPKSLVRLSML